MDKHEEMIVREMVEEFHSSFGYDPIAWVKLDNFYGLGIACLMACGRVGAGVVREISSGFEWMAKGPYTPTEMALLASGWTDDETEDLHVFGRIVDRVFACHGLFGSQR